MRDNDLDTESEVRARSVSWEELPDDVWGLILTNLDGGEKALKPISLVCKRFLTISNTARTSVYISGKSDYMPLQARFYSRFRFIKTICLMGIDPNLNTTITQLAHSNIPLTSLTLYGQIRLPEDAMRLLAQCMSKTLRSLSLIRFNVMTDDDLAIVADSFSYIHEFNITSSGYPIFSDEESNSEHVTDKGICQISTKLKSLVVLDVVNQECLTHHSLEYLASNCPSLRELSIGVYNPCKSSICLDQFKHLNFFGSLSSLGFMGLEISKSVLLQLTVQNLRVKKLELNGLKFAYNDNIPATMFCEFLTSCRSLQALKMVPLSFPSNIRAIDFANSIPGIRVIHLSDSYLNFMPAKMLFHLFRRCPLLEDINFSDRFLEIGPEWFNAPPPISKVRKLKFCCDDLCDESLTTIVTICPLLEGLSIFLSPKLTLDGVKAAITNCSNIKHLYVNGRINLADFMKKS